MDASDLRLGPVLSLRGLDRGEGGRRWKVSAMVVLPSRAGTPVLQLEGRDVGAPRVLRTHGDLQVLRYDLSTPVAQEERRVTYGFPAAGLSWSFTVPGSDLDLRLACVSCNGFSEAKKIREYAGHADAVWHDLVANHEGAGVQRFHVLVMHGDQVYLDSMWEEVAELQEWARLSHEEQRAHPATAQLRARIEDHYFGTYLQRWLPARRGEWNQARRGFDCADAMARIPTLMMWDDHDIFDGWGSYSQAMQEAPLPQAIFACARRAFWVFQMQHPAQLLPPLVRGGEDGGAPTFQPIAWSALREQDALMLPLLDDQPGFTSGIRLGPIALLAADLRTERSRGQVLGEATWRSVQRWLDELPAEASHLLFVSSVPVSYPSVAPIDDLHDLFGGEHVTESNADDLKDHWSHADHARERARLVALLVDTARTRRIRVTIVSGDVHVAAWGSLSPTDLDPEMKWLRVHELISSGVVHPPPSGPVQWIYGKLLNRAAASAQAIGTRHVAQMQVMPHADGYLLGQRNWLAIEADAARTDDAPRLVASWRCEGAGGSFSQHQVVIAPAPRD